jgi:hypothetical protein
MYLLVLTRRSRGSGDQARVCGGVRVTVAVAGAGRRAQGAATSGGGTGVRGRGGSECGSDDVMGDGR